MSRTILDTRESERDGKNIFHDHARCGRFRRFLQQIASPGLELETENRSRQNQNKPRLSNSYDRAKVTQFEQREALRLREVHENWQRRPRNSVDPFGPNETKQNENEKKNHAGSPKAKKKFKFNEMNIVADSS